MSPRPTQIALALGGALALAFAGPASAHHVGTWTPRDNELSANFKQLKFAVQARKYEVALDLFETGAIRREMRAQAAQLPAGLEGATRAALKAADAPGTELGLALLLAALVRDLAKDGDAKLGDAGQPAKARAAVGSKYLEAIWRYYNLVDFAVSQRDPKAAVAVRLAFDEAEGYLKPRAAQQESLLDYLRWVLAPARSRNGSKPAGAGTGSPDPERARSPLRRIAQTLDTLIDTTAPQLRSP